MKICSECKEQKEDDEFYGSKYELTGAIYLINPCKKCRVVRRANRTDEEKERERKLSRERAKQNKEKRKTQAREYRQKQSVKIVALIDTYRSKPCCDCGKEYDKRLMEFDHRPGTQKSFGVCSVLYSDRSLVTIQTEIDKCDVVCAMCHRLRTESRYPRISGKLSKTAKALRRLLKKVDDIKATTPCAGCGGFFHPRQMDFDHIDPTQKTENVSEIRRRRASWKEIEDEIAKCRVVCVACHKLHTFGIAKLDGNLTTPPSRLPESDPPASQAWRHCTYGLRFP